MQAENSLISLCVEVNTNGDVFKKIQRILGPDLNWAYFFERARSEGIMSWVYSRLSEIEGAQSLVPKDAWERLESSYYTVARRNIALTQKLNTILNSLNQAGIEVILLKGMALIHTIYPDIALRPMYDIDILIHKKDFSRVAEKLRELGYVNSTYYPEDFHQDNMMVDVHWELMNVTRIKSRKKSYLIDLDGAWRSSLPIEIKGEKTRILSPEYCLMDLCLHLAFHHGLEGLMWFIDIARLIELYKNEMDWHKFIEKSADYKICKPVYYVLFYVQNIIGQDIPQFVLEGLKPKKQNYLERKIFNLILSGAPVENARFFFTLAAMENWLDRLVFLTEIVLPAPQVLSGRYNISSARDIPRFYLIHLKSAVSTAFKLLQKISSVS
jgi:hypothetical protein